MRPHERRNSGQSDMFQPRLDQFIDMKHPMVKVAQATDWPYLEKDFGSVYTDKGAGDILDALLPDAEADFLAGSL